MEYDTCCGWSIPQGSDAEFTRAEREPSRPPFYGTHSGSIFYLGQGRTVGDTEYLSVQQRYGIQGLFYGRIETRTIGLLAKDRPLKFHNHQDL
ncbi:hypothetical protein [Maribacter sp. 2-571]|uniref:hypothetical protein n=1 Tax=Maribacter sp. 2-571 TaxID=3417569 RepID=UPI003D337A3C